MFTTNRYAFRQAGTDANAVQMARIHMENRRRYALAAAQAHQKGDSRAAAQFSELSLREDRLQKLWEARLSSSVISVDLHGLFVREAMEVVSQVLHSLHSGESVRVSLFRPLCCFQLIATDDNETKAHHGEREAFCWGCPKNQAGRRRLREIPES